jgi:hypothetical protein
MDNANPLTQQQKETLRGMINEIDDILEQTIDHSYSIAHELYLPARPDRPDGERCQENPQSKKPIEGILNNIRKKIIEINEILTKTSNKIS